MSDPFEIKLKENKTENSKMLCKSHISFHTKENIISHTMCQSAHSKPIKSVSKKAKQLENLQFLKYSSCFLIRWFIDSNRMTDI